MGFCGFWIWFAWLGRQGFWSGLGLVLLCLCFYHTIDLLFLLVVAFCLYVIVIYT